MRAGFRISAEYGVIRGLLTTREVFSARLTEGLPGICLLLNQSKYWHATSDYHTVSMATVKKHLRNLRCILWYEERVSVSATGATSLQRSYGAHHVLFVVEMLWVDSVGYLVAWRMWTGILWEELEGVNVRAGLGLWF